MVGHISRRGRFGGQEDFAIGGGDVNIFIPSRRTLEIRLFNYPIMISKKNCTGIGGVWLGNGKFSKQRLCENILLCTTFLCTAAEVPAVSFPSFSNDSCKARIATPNHQKFYGQITQLSLAV
jgi:hypothetical protein